MRALLALLLLGGILLQAPAQQTGEQPFVQDLLRYLARYNWDASETGTLERYLYSYEWMNLAGVDPEVVARALSYSRKQGIDTPPDLAEVAHQLSMAAKEMHTLGLEPREILRASMSAIRTVTTERYQGGNERLPDLAQTLRNAISRQIRSTERSSFRRQAQLRVSQPDRAGSGSGKPTGPGSGPEGYGGK